MEHELSLQSLKGRQEKTPPLRNPKLLEVVSPLDLSLIRADQRADREKELAAIQYFAEAFARSATALAEHKTETEKHVAATEVDSSSLFKILTC